MTAPAVVDEWTYPARAGLLLVLVLGPSLVLLGVIAWVVSRAIGLGS